MSVTTYVLQCRVMTCSQSDQTIHQETIATVILIEALRGSVCAQHLQISLSVHPV